MSGPATISLASLATHDGLYVTVEHERMGFRAVLKLCPQNKVIDKRIDTFDFAERAARDAINWAHSIGVPYLLGSHEK